MRASSFSAMGSTDAPKSETDHLVQPDERVELGLGGLEGELLVTDGGVVVSDDARVRLDVPYEGLRRVQFDLESGRPAVLVVVPHRPTDLPQTLTIPRERVPRAAEVLAFVSRRLP
jgi:hypothetical protein